MKKSKDFVIANGHLKEYIGNDTNVVIPDGVEVVDIGAFKNCNNLVSVTFPDGITELNSPVFYACPGLKAISLPRSIEKIQGELFLFCPEISTFIFPEGIENFKSSFLNQLWENVNDKYNKRALTYSLIKQYPDFVGRISKLKKRAQSNIKPFIKRALSEDDAEFFFGLFTYAQTLSVEEFEDYVERCKKSITLEQLTHYHKKFEEKLNK